MWAQYCPQENHNFLCCCCFATCGGVDGMDLERKKNKKRNPTAPSLESPQRVRAWPSFNKINNKKQELSNPRYLQFISRKSRNHPTPTQPVTTAPQSLTLGRQKKKKTERKIFMG
jgi:hypothetical protein